jgi:hypothetical protein
MSDLTLLLTVNAKAEKIFPIGPDRAYLHVMSETNIHVFSRNKLPYNFNEDRLRSIIKVGTVGAALARLGFLPEVHYE